MKIWYFLLNAKKVVPKLQSYSNSATMKSKDNYLIYWSDCTSIGRFLINGRKERGGTERVGKTNGNGFEKYKRDGKMNEYGYGLNKSTGTNGFFDRST